ncbi:hypothetical protein GCM10029992_09320 [Glycomyces albus]
MTARTKATPLGRLKPLPAGPRGVLIDCGTGEAARACYRALQARRVNGALEATDLIPGATTVLVDGVEEPELLAADIPEWVLGEESEPAREPVEIPIAYDGPDIEAVAGHWGVGVDEVAEIHASVEYEAAFCGFTPASPTSRACRNAATPRGGTTRVSRSRPGRSASPGRIPACIRVRAPAAGS